jgi:hypothetical protein
MIFLAYSSLGERPQSAAPPRFHVAKGPAHDEAERFRTSACVARDGCGLEWHGRYAKSERFAFTSEPISCHASIGR